MALCFRYTCSIATPFRLEPLEPNCASFPIGKGTFRSKPIKEADLALDTYQTVFPLLARGCLCSRAHLRRLRLGRIKKGRGGRMLRVTRVHMDMMHKGRGRGKRVMRCWSARLRQVMTKLHHWLRSERVEFAVLIEIITHDILIFSIQDSSCDTYTSLPCQHVRFTYTFDDIPQEFVLRASF